MKRDHVGRFIPSRPIEHLFYWPLVIGGLIALYFAVGYIVEFVRPANNAFGAWMTSIFADWAGAVFAIIFFPLCVLLYVWVSRKPTDAPPLPPP